MGSTLARSDNVGSSTSTEASRRAKRKALAAAEREQSRHRGLWKVLATGSAVVAGILTARLLDATWKTATGHKAPNKPEHPDLDAREAIAWAAVSGMAIGIAKVFAARKAANYWVKSTGRLPPGMEPEAVKLTDD